jgi:phage gp36-like protein
MAYCSITAIYDMLPKLPDTNTSAGYTQCAATIDTHIRRTDGLINGKCARRYSVPFDPVPPFIRTIAEDITCYYTMRSFYSQDAQNRNEWATEHKDNALEFLDEIMSGDIDLVDTSGSAVPVQEDEIIDQVSSNTQDYQPYFDIDSDMEWKFDEDLEDEISANR